MIKISAENYKSSRRHRIICDGYTSDAHPKMGTKISSEGFGDRGGNVFERDTVGGGSFSSPLREKTSRNPRR